MAQNPFSRRSMKHCLNGFRCCQNANALPPFQNNRAENAVLKRKLWKGENPEIKKTNPKKRVKLEYFKRGETSLSVRRKEKCDAVNATTPAGH
ncbi:hypothetical protein AGI97_002369 [Cronobacter sakazakii]|nr:hypothetical protein [Cronobacter sakazakii]EJJ0669943.1 hypothetical protein [Cronobacter sakazakii]